MIKGELSRFSGNDTDDLSLNVLLISLKKTFNKSLSSLSKAERTSCCDSNQTGIIKGARLKEGEANIQINDYVSLRTGTDEREKSKADFQT